MSTAVNTCNHRLRIKFVVGFPSVHEVKGVLFKAGPSTAENATSPVAVQQQVCVPGFTFSGVSEVLSIVLRRPSR